MDLPKTYNPKDVEDEIYKRWEESGYFNPDNLERAHDRFWKAEVFSMAMPPPNITAELHVGHAMFLTIQDLMTRHARMSGKKTLWLPGTDHAAIATQNVVERELWEKEKKTRHDLGRAELLQRIEKFMQKTRGRIQVQIRKMGSSCDWSREKYTLSPELSLAVRAAFKKMHDAGLIYRGERIVNWCPRCGTTLADDEVEYQEVPGELYYVRYPLVQGQEGITVATARPETILADTAVAVNPNDARYKKFVGKTVMLPLFNRELPVIADSHIDRNYGTGAMKVTPGQDLQDFEIGKRHNLEIINLFTPQGVIDEKEASDHGFEDYAGLTPEEARQKIVAELQGNGFLEKIENITHNVGYCYRCESVVEPIISKQWFVNVNQKFLIQDSSPLGVILTPERSRRGKDPKAKRDSSADLDRPQNDKSIEASLKQIAIAAVKSGAIKIVPERFTKTYLQWMENLRDWNISRQIWFGHRIPVWYCGEEKKETTAPATKIMGFHESVVPQVLEGKTKTYRLRDHGFEVGDEVVFENSQTGTSFGYGTITNIEKTAVGKVDLQDPAHGATYEKREELIERFKLHYPDRKVTDDTEVFIYTYEFSSSVTQQIPEGCGEIIVAVDPPTKCPVCGNITLTQDPDTLDTWFSSSLWTFSTLGWPQETLDLKTYHPTTILETGYDILFFWVARMVLMTGFVLEDVPFRTVYLNGLVRDKQGRKMSKSLRNALDPLEVSKKFGTDALRLSLIMGTTPGNDLKISEQKIAGFRNFANKLWNISRFVLSLNPSPRAGEGGRRSGEGKSLADQWILSELELLIASVNKNFTNYQYGLAAEALYDFTWNKFADWYLEIAKLTLKRHPEGAERPKDPDVNNPYALLTYVLTNLLKLWHPFIPFVTEHIWSQFSEELLMIQEYPLTLFPSPLKRRESGGEGFPKIQSLITGLRNLRAEYRQDPGETFASYLELPKELDWIKEQLPIIEKLACVKINFAKIPADKKMPYFLWSASPAGGENTKVYLIIPDFDPKKEKALAEKELKAVNARIAKLKAQLTKKDFLKKAPAEVVEKIKGDAATAATRATQLKEKINSLR